MVADTRPALKIQNIAEGHSNVRRDLPTSSSRKNDTLGIRRPHWELPPKKKIPTSFKSKNVEQEMPFRQPLSKTISQAVEHHVSSTPMNRSDRDKNPISRSYIWRNAESRNPLHSRRRKEESLTQVTRESKNAEADPEEVEPKKKRMNLGAYVTPLKRQRVNENEPGSSLCHDQSTQRDGGGNMFGGSSFSSKASAEEAAVSLDEQNNLQLLQSEIDKLCRILKLSEDTALATRRFLEYVSQNRRVHSDKPAIRHAFQISLCWAGASISKQQVDKRVSLSSANQLLNYKCTEQEARYVYSKMRSLKKMYLQCSESASDSGRNCLSAEDFSKGSLGTEQSRLLFPSLKEKSGGIKVEDTTVNSKHDEGHIISRPKQNQNVKAASREINENINEKKKKKSTSMDKLKHKQDNETQEFLRTWEEKKCQLHKDYKLELAFTRCIYRQGSVRIEKLKILDDSFSKKIEDYHRFKKLKLDNLKAQPLAARIEEQMGSDVDDSQSSAHIHIIGTETAFSASNQHLEIQNEGESLSAPSNNTNACEEARRCDSPIETSSDLVNVNSRNEVIVTPLPKSSSPAPSAVEDIGSGSSKEIPDTSPNEVPNLVQTVESIKESQKTFDEAITSAWYLVNQRDASDEVTNKSSVPSAEPLIRSAQTSVLPYCTDLPPQQVSQDVLLQDSVPAELQGQNAPTLENHSTSPIPCSMPGTVETIDTVPSDESVAPLLASNDETSHVAENSEQLHPVDFSNQQSNLDNAPVDVSRYQSPVTEPESIEIVAQESIPQRGERLEQNCNPVLESARISSQGQNMETSSSRVMEPGLIEMISQLQISQLRGSLGTHGCYHDLESCRISPQGHNTESSSPLQITTSIPLAAESTSGSRNQNVALGVDAGHHPGPNNHFIAPRPPPQTNPRSAVHTSTTPDPLRYALELMQKESESMKKRRADKVLEMRCERDKEIQETLKKYEQKFQDSEAEFILKKMEHHITMEKFRMNMILAQRLRNLSSNPRGFCQMQRVFQNQQQRPRELAMQGSMRPNHLTSSHLPGPSHPNPNPNPAPRPVHRQQSQPPPIRSSPHLTRNLVPPPLPNVQPFPTLPRMPTPPLGSITRPFNGNPLVAGEVRTRAPRLQSSYRSNVPPSTAGITPGVMPSQTVQGRFPPRPSMGASVR